MTFLSISGFYPGLNPDNALQYEKDEPQELETEVLSAMGWKSLVDVPMGENDLTTDQTVAVLAILGDPIKDDLMYCIGLCR
ncbi:hypothetical protein AFK24_07245 [Pseudomonas syringae]|uniref:Uncharacterized protein n=1 Tax=Pseudomonas syringae TaxID=317 RepID=A0A1C7ZBS3_PSESX|nr:pyocin S6 family toxin immunity protein [Pseudomonas syringae]OCR25745.1 hypothetical protein AFK24_07245 [Pseudomonas syringae]